MNKLNIYLNGKRSHEISQYIIDTPNVVFTRNGFDLKKGLILQTWITKSKEKEFVILITPKLKKMAARWVKRIRKLAQGLSNITAYSTHHHDPDAVILRLSSESGFCVLSNDKFRQPIYDIFRNVSINVIGFCIWEEKGESKLKIRRLRVL